MHSPGTLSEERRLQIIEQIRSDAAAAGRPDFDVEGTIAGHLAGPASADRPNVPVWEYRAYADVSDSTIEELADVRFPVEFVGGESTVTSIAEELRPLPVPSDVCLTADDIIRRYEMMHTAGVLGWDSDKRSIVHLKGMTEYRIVLQAWFAEIRASAEESETDSTDD